MVPNLFNSTINANNVFINNSVFNREKRDSNITETKTKRLIGNFTHSTIFGIILISRNLNKVENPDSDTQSGNKTELNKTTTSQGPFKNQLRHFSQSGDINQEKSNDSMIRQLSDTYWHLTSGKKIKHIDSMINATEQNVNKSKNNENDSKRKSLVKSEILNIDDNQTDVTDFLPSSMLIDTLSLAKKTGIFSSISTLISPASSSKSSSINSIFKNKLLNKDDIN